MSKKVMVLCLYGCQLTDSYKEYLDHAYDYACRNKVGCLVLAGGYTNQRTNPGRSEASVACNYLTGKLCENVAPCLQCNHEPILLREVAEYVAEERQGDEIVVYCLEHHARKNHMHFEMNGFRSSRMKFVGYGKGQYSWREVLAQDVACALEWLAYYIYPLYWLQRAYRRWKIARS